MYQKVLVKKKGVDFRNFGNVQTPFFLFLNFINLQLYHINHNDLH